MTFPSPAPPACAGSTECVPTDWDPPGGVCLFPGTGAPGTACTVTNSSTGCMAGYLCLGDLNASGYSCRQRCDFFSSSPSCSQSGQHCIFYGYCSGVQGDSAAIGDDCTLAHGMPCGPSGTAYEGACAIIGSGAPKCGLVCRIGVASDCPAGQSCVQAFSNFSTIGTCRP